MALFKTLKTFFAQRKNRNTGLNKAPASQPARNSRQTAHTSLIQTSYPTDLKQYHELEQTYYQYFIGVNSLMELELNDFECQVLYQLDVVQQESEATLAEQIPRLPDITPKLIHLLRSENFSWKSVAHLIAQDPVLLVEIIKLANSSRFNLQASEDKLEHILVQLGVLEVRKVLMKVALKPIMLFEGGHFLKHSGSKIWIHSVKTAEVCQLLAQQQKLDAFEAYLSGLLHNLGMTIVVQTMNGMDNFKDAPRSIQFKERLLKRSRQLSVLIAKSWAISQPVSQAIADQIETQNRRKTPLGELLTQANAVSMRHTLEQEHRWPEMPNSETTAQMFYNQLKTELDRLDIH